ncbi:MPN domain-containing protein-like protein, partial [Euroglyphus maynei]
MDLHSHCRHNEVIGCLGGYYCRVTKTLYVLTTVPGSSVDDHFNQCELDAVSYVDAINEFEKQNLHMVGWYHSHPKFSTKPSIVDIQTQKYNQEVFFQRYSNDEKNNKQQQVNDEQTVDERLLIPPEEKERTFVGFIITPFLVQPIGSTLLSSKSFTRYQPHSERSIGSKFIANNTCYDYHHNYGSSYCYFTPELNSTLASTIKCFWVGGPQYSKDV